MSTKSIDETTKLRVSSKRYTTEDLLCFFCMQHATTCHQQSVRSNESLLRPATRKSGITSLRRSGRTSRCGRNNPRYVCNALSHAGSVSSVYFLFLLRNLNLRIFSLSQYALLRVCTIPPNMLVLQIVFLRYHKVSDQLRKKPNCLL